MVPLGAVLIIVGIAFVEGAVVGLLVGHVLRGWLKRSRGTRSFAQDAAIGGFGAWCGMPISSAFRSNAFDPVISVVPLAVCVFLIFIGVLASRRASGKS